MSFLFTETNRGSVAADQLAAAVRANEGPIHVAFATVTGRLDLSSTNFDHRLVINDSDFEGPVDLSDATFAKTVDLSRCIFSGPLTLAGAGVGGSLLLNGARVLRGADPAEPARFGLLRVEGDLIARGLNAGVGLDFAQVQVRGRFDLSSTALRRTVCSDDLRLHGAAVGGDLWGRGVEIKGDLDLEGAVLQAGLSFGPLRQKPDDLVSTVVQTTSLTGSVDLTGARITGEVDFSAANVGGDLVLQCAQIQGGLFVRCIQGRKPTIGGNLRGPAARVSATADFSGAEIEGDLTLEGAQVEGSVFLWPGYDSIDGAPPAAPAVAGAPPPPPPDLRTSVRGGVNFSHTKITGGVNGRDVRVGGVLTLEGATITGAVEFSGAQLGYDPKVGPPPVPLPGFDPSYCVFANSARITGALIFSGATARGGLFLQSARVEGGMFLRTYQFSTGGASVLKHPWIGGSLILAAAQLIGEADLRAAEIRGGLVLDRAAIDGQFRCRFLQELAPPPDPPRPRVTAVGLELNLRNCTIRHLDLRGDDADDPPLPPTLLERARVVNVRLDGCQFQELTVPDDDYLFFFHSGNVEFHQSNYTLVERWLRNRGEEDAANLVYQTMRRHRRERGKMSRMHRLVDCYLIGGIQTLAANFLWLLAVLLGTVVVSAFLYADPAAVQFKGKGGDAPPWTWGEAAWLAVQTNFPMLHLPVSDKWEPSSSPMALAGGWTWPLRYDQWAGLTSVWGYVAVPLIIGGVANRWLRQRGAGG